MRKTYTVPELEELAQMPESELEPAERRAVLKYRRSHAPVSVNAGSTPVLPTPVEQPILPNHEAGESSVVQPAPGSEHTGLVDFIGYVLPDDAVVNRRALPKWRWQAVELRTRPGVWAVLTQMDSRTQATSLASAIRIGKLVAFAPQGLFEAVARTWTDGTHHVYARYVGEKS
jgi:hypothetical protein